ncbi:hypothetical protein MWU32_04600 [Gelidibacter sp. F63206]|nr:MauE/DoxX family redox-associated membrane protein [Gelidibacter sp. F63206]MCK0115254.1 hypothetical protein [Gelidibacter sp. F63206]
MTLRWDILKHYILEIVSLLFILLFVYAAASKLLDHSQFYNDLRNSVLFGNPIASTVISWGIPIL